MKVIVKGLKVTIKEYPNEITYEFDDDYTMHCFLLNICGMELNKHKWG